MVESIQAFPQEEIQKSKIETLALLDKVNKMIAEANVLRS